MGRLAAIARKSSKGAPMEELSEARISEAAGLEGDARGQPGSRQITVVATGGWAAACADLGAEVPWTLRRANLLVEGVELPRTAGTWLNIGDVVLEVTGETTPCERMDQEHAGLRAALAPDWRAGCSCRVLSGGDVSVGDAAAVLKG
jgi:MOSC domain-containing protein YiiM